MSSKTFWEASRPAVPATCRAWLRWLLIEQSLFYDCSYSSNCQDLISSIKQLSALDTGGLPGSRPIHLGGGDARHPRRVGRLSRPTFQEQVAELRSHSTLGRDTHTKRLIPRSPVASTLALAGLTRRTSKCHLTVSRGQSHDKAGQITPSIIRVTAAAEDGPRCVSIDHINTLPAGAG